MIVAFVAATVSGLLLQLVILGCADWLNGVAAAFSLETTTLATLLVHQRQRAAFIPRRGTAQWWTQRCRGREDCFYCRDNSPASPMFQLRMATPRVGLVGLPNVGKSTLFNAVSKTAELARAANFPFCTIDPNKAPVAVPDPYLRALSESFTATTAAVAYADKNSSSGYSGGGGPIRPARIELIDVAGLVRGSSRGEGLGNRFLAAIRECDVIVHVLRCFPDKDVIRHESLQETATTTNNNNDLLVDPVFDAKIVEEELLLADLAHVERRIDRIKDDSSIEKIALAKIRDRLLQSTPARLMGLSHEEKRAIKSMGLLTLKPVVFAFNVDEIDFTANREQTLARIRTELMPKIRYHKNTDENDDNNISNGEKEKSKNTDERTEDFVLVSAKLEEDLLSLGGEEEQDEYISELMTMGTTINRNDDGAGNEAEKNYSSEKCVSSSSIHQQRHQYQDFLSCNVIPKLVCEVLSLSLCYTGPGVPPERSRTTKAYLFKSSSTVGSNDGSNNNSGTETSRPAESATTGMTVLELAGKIHGEIQRGFIRAEVIDAKSLLRFGSYREAKESGSVRIEGREYALAPDDTVLIKWK